MTTTTEQKRPPSLGQVERLKDLREDVTDRLETLGARLDAITSELAGLRVEGDEEGDEATALREERAELQDERDELEATLPALDERIQETAEQACAAEAEKVRASIKKRGGGIVGQFSRDLSWIREQIDKMREKFDHMESRRAVVGLLAAQDDALARRFDLEPAELKSLDDEAVRKLQRLRSRAAKLGESGEIPEPPVGLDRLDPVAAAAVSADRLKALGEDAPSVEILEKLGERTHPRPEDVRAAARAERKAGSVNQLRRAVEAMKEWLEPRLAGNPVPTDRIFEQASRERFPNPGRPGLDKVLATAASELGYVQAKRPQGGMLWVPEDDVPKHLTVKS